MGTLQAQLLLQFSTDCFETLQMFSAWNEDVHVVSDAVLNGDTNTDTVLNDAKIQTLLNGDTNRNTILNDATNTCTDTIEWYALNTETMFRQDRYSYICSI